MTAPMSQNEAARLEALHAYAILDTPAEAAFDDLVRLAALICQTPMATISLVDSDRQWFKSRLGVKVSATPREESFCSHAITHPDDLFIVPDATLDERFAGLALVREAPHIRFYAGARLLDAEGHALGMLCVLDRTPRTLEEAQK